MPTATNYVGELRGFPATPGTSEIWRIAPDSVDAVCDPEAPDTGDCQRYADGLTSIVDLSAGKDGSIYALEVAKASWFQVEAGLAEPIGGLFRIAAPGSEPTELAADQLFVPGGIDVTSGSTLYVTTPIVPAGPGALVEVSE